MEHECVARVKNVKALDVAFLDQRIPRYERDIINMVGMGVTENADTYVNLSIHTAPDVRPLPWHSGQWAKSAGFARRSRSNQSLAPLVQWTIRLYLRRAHRMT